MNDNLQKTLDTLNKRYGSNTVMQGLSVVDVDAISTGSYGLDQATGVGGFPRSKITHLWGDFSTGKSTLCLQAVANVQKAGGVAAFVDMEHGVDSDYATALGVDMSKLALSQPGTGEQALEIADALMRTGEVQLVIIDSIPALTPQAQIEGEYTDKNYGAIAHLLSRSLSKLKGAASNNNVALIFTNQERVDLKGYAPPGSTYTPKKPYGGEAIKFYADITIHLRRRFEKETRQDQQIVSAECQKNKLANPFKKAEFVIEYGKGVDNIQELFTLAVQAELITQKGAWYYHGTDTKWHGKDAAVDALRADSELANEIRERILG